MTNVRPWDSIKEKIQQALTRMKKIEWIPATLQRKALLIQASCWPLALYTSDTTYIGQQHYVALRRGVVQSLVGQWHTSSPFLACSVLSEHLIDPFLHTLCSCARTVRRLANVQPQEAVETIRRAVDFQGKRAFGPATTLKLYLNHVNCDLQYDGTISGPELQHCNILKDSTGFITRNFRRMWSSFIVQAMTRKGIGQHIINIDCTRRVFSKLTDEEQQLVKLNMVGGFQTEKRKAHWDDTNDGKCPFCQCDDTRPHRLLECEEFKPIREQFPKVLLDLQHDKSDWVYLPLAIEPSMVTILQNFLEKVKNPVIPSVLGGNRNT